MYGRSWTRGRLVNRVARRRSPQPQTRQVQEVVVEEARAAALLRHSQPPARVGRGAGGQAVRLR